MHLIDVHVTYFNRDHPCKFVHFDQRAGFTITTCSLISSENIFSFNED